MNPRRPLCRAFLGVCVAAAFLFGVGISLLGTCGPFSDVAADSFCPFVLEIFYLGITTGTTPTTYAPSSPVTRLQMAAFLSRSVDSVLKRGRRRAAMNQLWTTQNSSVLGITTVGAGTRLLRCDGADVWVANAGSGTVSRVRGSDGRLLETWTGAFNAFGVLVAMNRVLVTGLTNGGQLYMIKPSQAAGAVTTVASNLGDSPTGIAFDGARFWTANQGGDGSVSIITPSASTPWPVITVTVSEEPGSPLGALYDGANVWITDHGLGRIVKLDSNGVVLQTVTVGTAPFFPAFDGTNIWVPNSPPSTVSVVRASTGVVLQTLTGNGLFTPTAASFDGERILVTNFSGDSVSLWKAADLSPLGTFPTGTNTNPQGVCSDGVAFWIGFNQAGRIARF